MKKQPKKQTDKDKLHKKFPKGKIPFSTMMELAVKTTPEDKKKGKKKT